MRDPLPSINLNDFPGQIGRASGTRDKANKSGTVPDVPGRLEPMFKSQQVTKHYFAVYWWVVPITHFPRPLPTRSPATPPPFYPLHYKGVARPLRWLTVNISLQPRTMSFSEKLPNRQLGLKPQKDYDIASELEVCFLNEDERDHPNDTKRLEDFLLSDFNVSLSDKRMSFMDALAAPLLTFKLCLHCTAMATKEEVKLTVSEAFLNYTVDKLKLVIEHQQDIPASCQTLTFGGSILEGQHLISHYYLRNGDSLVVSFEGTGNVKEVLSGVNRLREVYHWLRASEKDLREGSLSDGALEELLSRKDQSCTDDFYCRFLLSSNDKRQINRRFFVECGGLIILRILHEELLKYPATHLPSNLLGMEKVVLRLYWNFSVCSATFPRMWKSKVLRNISRSFLRVKFDSTVGVQVQNLLYTGNSQNYEANFHLFLKYVIMNAMGALCK